MIHTVVPAQVTTVEDRIVGNLGMTQVILLATPILLAGLVFVFVPPTMQFTTYKVVGLTLLMAVFGTLAIRIKDKLVLFWIVMRVRYNVRPRYYVFNKNSTANREQYRTAPTELLADEPEKVKVRRQASKLTTAETVNVLDTINNPAANLTFATSKKGSLYVRITEVKSKS